MAYEPHPISRPHSPTSRSSILRNIVVERGPVDTLGPFFRLAEAETRKRGVVLEFCKPQDLVAANEVNRKSWLPLVPMFDPRNGVIAEDNSFCILGRNARGEVVTANSIIKYDWPDTDFVEEATSLRLFYSDPERMRQPSEQCIVTSTRARCIRGRAAFSGAAWVRPDHRGLGLSEYLPRLIKAYAASQWSLDCIFGMMAEAVEKRGHAPRFGYDNIDWEARWLNSVLGTLRLAILWTDVGYLMRDLRSLLAGAAAQTDGEVLEQKA
jgi:hypothetical protein